MIGAHNLGGLRQAFRGISRKCGFRRVRRQQIGKTTRIKHRLRCAIRSDRIHGVCRVTQQRYAAVCPEGQRVSITHWVFPEFASGAHQRSNIQEGNTKPRDMREHFFKLARSRPIFAPRWRFGRITNLRANHPIGQSRCGGSTGADRVKHQLFLHIAGDNHGVATFKGGPFHRATPHLNAIPANAAIIRM